MTEGSLQREAAATRRRLGRVLVTGANGFIGAVLVDRLRRDGEEVVATDLDRGGAALGDFQTCDITDPHQVERLFARGPFDTIFHGGAISGPMVMQDRPLEIWRINSLGTAHLLDAARRHPVGRFILCSSCSVYGAMDGGTIDEATPPDPAGVYGASKVAAEQAMAGFAREYGIDAAGPSHANDAGAVAAGRNRRKGLCDRRCALSRDALCPCRGCHRGAASRGAGQQPAAPSL
jgi:nucleoside-diphosphate-sugar epimerase